MDSAGLVELHYGSDVVYVDVVAERSNTWIAVEVKSFDRSSDIYELSRAVGQYILYRTLLEVLDPACALYLAVPGAVYRATFATPLSMLITQREQIRLVLIDSATRRIERWIDP